MICSLKNNLKSLFAFSAVFALFVSATPAYAQLPSFPGDNNAPQSSALPGDEADPFSFEGDETLDFEENVEEQRELARKEAFDAALQGLLPLRPEEIRSVLERFDRTQESVETPVYPNPKPEVVVQNISLDPGAKPAVIKLAYGHVTTVAFLDSSGAPWPIQDVSWAGNFEVMETEQDPERFSHVFRISPQSEFAYGNMSISLLSLMTPVIITLETNRDVVHYRFDALLPEYGPLAEAPLIEAGITTSAGDRELSAILEGVVPEGAERLDVEGVDGRTSAYRHNELVYLRTPLTLLSPGWNSSTASADGTRVYELENAPVVLLSDRGRMVRARLTNRENVIEDFIDE